MLDEEWLACTHEADKTTWAGDPVKGAAPNPAATLFIQDRKDDRPTGQMSRFATGRRGRVRRAGNTLTKH